MNTASEQPPAPSLSEKLRNAHVGLREDLDVSRHQFRGQPSYIVRDPISFQSQRLDVGDYGVFVRIQPDRSLGVIFDELVEQDLVDRADEQKFYEFILSLHRVGFLQLPISDEKALFRRHLARQRARRKEKLLGFLFLRVPLWNPNAFLEKTIRHVRFVFSVPFFIAWVTLVVAAGVVLACRWSEVTQPIQGLLATGNLPAMWITLIVLKLCHEFGHAYTCRHYGGHVPEMGAYLILLTPCAYVDATASWGFTHKRHRVYVCLAGVYVEVFIAALAVFVWALTESSLVHSVAYNIIFLATVLTLMFNINPLMRFDGYYILSDLLEIPNLRAKSTEYVRSVLKRVLLGVPMKARPRGRRLGVTLFVFGVAASWYRAALIIGIACMLAAKMFYVGMALAISYIGAAMVKLVLGITQYLWYSKETAAIRYRAIALSLLALIIVPAALFAIPVPSHVYARGVLASESETVIRVREDGVLVDLPVVDDQVIAVGDRIARLHNDSFDELTATATAQLRASEIRVDAFRGSDVNRMLQEQEQAQVHRHMLEDAQGRAAQLDVRSPMAGRVVSVIKPAMRGAFLVAGTPLATIVESGRAVTTILSEQQMASAKPRIGQSVAFKPAAIPALTLQGVITRISPGGSKVIDVIPLTHLGGGDVAVDPATGRAQQPYFVLTIDLLQTPPRQLRYGITGTLRLAGGREPIGTRWTRRLVRFVNSLVIE